MGKKNWLWISIGIILIGIVGASLLFFTNSYRMGFSNPSVLNNWNSGWRGGMFGGGGFGGGCCGYSTFGWLAPLFGFLIFAGFLTLISFGIASLVKSSNNRSTYNNNPSAAFEILQSRYARNEITREQYYEMRDVLSKNK